jgi:hypothetical protein
VCRPDPSPNLGVLKKLIEDGQRDTLSSVVALLKKHLPAAEPQEEEEEPPVVFWDPVSF